MRRHLWAVVGVALLIVGAVIVQTSAGVNEFGWFAYAPLDGAEIFPADLLIVTRSRVIGFVVVGLGLLVLAAGVGYRAGRRARQ